MLTKDLVRIKRRGEKWYPQFLDLKSAAHLELAGGLLQTAAESIGLSIGQLQQAIKTQALEREPKLTKGLLKVLGDACSAQPEGKDIAVTRWLILETAQTIRTENTWPNPADFLRRVADEIGMSIEALQKALYADLPDLQQVERVPEWTPQEFVGRYNLALLQALFFRTEKLVLTCKQPSMPDLRRFGRALKFHKLLATGKNEGDTWHFEISGPLAAHLDQAQVYGMHFVRLIPAILRLPRFEVELNFDWQDKTAVYTFTESLAKSWALDKQGTGYYPEELDASMEQLKDKLDATYQLQTSQEMLTFPDGSTCIPDWTIVHQNTGETIHVELFHRWHQDAFQKRLQQLQSGALKQRLIVGACRSLIKQKSVERWLKDFPHWDQNFGFSFRDFPTIEQLQDGLKQGLSQR